MASAEPSLGSEFNRIALNTFGRSLSSTEQIAQVFSAIDFKIVTFIDLEGTAISAGFIREVMKGCLEKSEKLIISNGTEDQINLVNEIIIELDIKDKVKIM